MFQFINPIFLLKKLFKMAKELNNLYFYHSKLNDMKKRSVFKFFDLHIDKLNRIYAFINLPPELLIVENKVELDKHEREFIGNEMLKFVRPFDDNQLFDLYHIKYERYKDGLYYGYKVTFHFKFRELTFIWTLWLAAYSFILYKVISAISFVAIDHGIRATIHYIGSLFK